MRRAIARLNLVRLEPRVGDEAADRAVEAERVARERGARHRVDVVWGKWAEFTDWAFV